MNSFARGERSTLLGLYLRLSPLLAPLWRQVLRRRLSRGKETAQSLAQKLSQDLPPRPDGPVLWGHAVGVGETLALAGLFTRLAERHPDLNFVLTSVARSSADALGKAAMPPRSQHQFAPIDTPQAVTRFLDHWRPVAAVWCELDLWPRTIVDSAARGFPLLLVNARYKDADIFATDRRKRLARSLYRNLLGRFETIYAQNELSKEALLRLGVAAERVRVGGNIKALAPGLRCDPLALSALRSTIGTRPCWVLASSHAGEEAVALAAHQLLRERFPDALLVIAPRYIARGPEIAALAGASCRSAGAQPRAAESVYVADTMGELGLWYRLAPIALVGGSLVPIGGHNPWEARALGCRVLFGPQVFNFTEAYQMLAEEGWAAPVNDADGIAAQVAACWARPNTPGNGASPRHRAGAADLLEELGARLAVVIGGGEAERFQNSNGEQRD